MYAKIAILLLGLAVAANAQCSCGGVKSCLESKKPQRPQKTQAQTDCINGCNVKLPGNNPSAVKSCLEQERGAREAIMGAKVNCLLTSSGVPCSRKRRQNVALTGQAQAQTNAQVAGQSVQSNTNVQVSAGAKVGDLLKPYFQCVHQCFGGVVGDAEGAAGGAVGGAQGHLQALSTCTVSAGCSVTLDTLTQKATSCKADPNVKSLKEKAKQNLCSCMKTATGQDGLVCGGDSHSGGN
jgi:hypothetical protein